MNTDLKKKATSNFEKYVLKLINNAEKLGRCEKT